MKQIWMLTEKVKARFRERISKAGPLMPGMTTCCWLWTGGKHDSKKYGGFQFNNDWWYAHRFAWVLSGRTLPPINKTLHHKCHNPLCVRPSHLKVLTSTWHGKLHGLNGKVKRIYIYGMPKGDRIKVMRLKALYGKCGLAQLLGISSSAVNSWAYGHRKPSKKLMAHIDELYKGGT